MPISRPCESRTAAAPTLAPSRITDACARVMLLGTTTAGLCITSATVSEAVKGSRLALWVGGTSLSAPSRPRVTIDAHMSVEPRPTGDMDPETYRQDARRIADWVADY